MPTLHRLGHKVHRLSETDCKIAANVEAALARHGQAASPSTWARVFSDPSLLPCVAEAYAACRCADLVIGHELTPNQIRVLAAEGVPFLDVSIDPVRFAPDLFLRMRSNDARLVQALEGHDQTDADMLPHAARLRSLIAKPDGQTDHVPLATLFVGQTDIDGSLVCDGRLARIDGFVGEIASLLDAGGQLMLKPHPYGRTHQAIRTLREAFPASLIVNDNIYALIASPQVERVVTLSSGVAQEARLIGKPATSFVEPDSRRGKIGDELVSRDFRIGLNALSPAFWNSLDGRAGARGTHPAPVLNGELRRSVGQSWAYTAKPRLNRRSLVPGQVLSFAENGAGLELCAFGWSSPERTGTWTDGPLATMLVDTQGERLDLTIECRVFAPAEAKPVVVAACIGRAGPARRYEFHRHQQARFVIELPETSGIIEVVLHISGTTRPRDAGLGNDVRDLGLHVVKAAVSHRKHPARLLAASFGILQRVSSKMRVAAGILLAASGLG